jgi:hypothetical protein
MVKEVKGVMRKQRTLIALNVDDLLITFPYKQMNYDLESAFYGEFNMKIMANLTI